MNAETRVKLLSAPQVVVVDNKTANFRVGDPRNGSWTATRVRPARCLARHNEAE